MAVTANDNKISTITLPVAQNQATDFAKVFKKYIFHWPIFFYPWRFVSFCLFFT